MKKLLILGVFALLGSTTISCTADEYESSVKNESKKADQPIPSGPDDDPVIPPKPPGPK